MMRLGNSIRNIVNIKTILVLSLIIIATAFHPNYVISAERSLTVDTAPPLSDGVAYRVSDNRIAVYYRAAADLNNPVSMMISFDKGETSSQAQGDLSGDIGVVDGAGRKRIEWLIDDSLLPESDIVIILRSGDSNSADLSDIQLQTETIAIPRITGEIELDGFSDEAAWNAIESLKLMQQQPVFGVEPSEKTEIRLAHDDNYVYVSARLYDSEPSEIHASTMKRDDDDASSDHFGIILDTFNDNENALAFLTTPTGSRIDTAIYGDYLSGGSASGGSNKSWNTFWDVETKITNDGWFAEMRIPLSSLRFQQNGETVVMGIAAFRWIARKSERIVYPSIPPRWGSHSHLKPSKAADAAFTGIQSKKPLYITPFFVGGLSETYNLNDAADKYVREEETSYEGGLDVKYGLSSNMTLDLTYNTDFAQVEADNQQVNLTRFSLYFPEKRQFFLERSSIFDFRFYGRNRLFHSRKIGISDGGHVPILGGARLVGRLGNWDVGLINMQTDDSGDLLSENFSVLRLRRRVFNEQSFIGGMATSRVDTDSNYNAAYGVDGSINAFGDDILKFNWAQTFETDAENDASSLDISKIRVHWERYSFVGLAYGLNYSNAGKDYNPGIGFEQYNNLTNYIHFVRYGWIMGKDSWIYQHHIFEDLWVHIRNEDNSIKTLLARAGWYGSSKSGFSGNLSLTYNQEDVREVIDFSDDAIVPPDEYQFYGLTGRFSTPSGYLVRFSSSFKGGQFYDGKRATISLSPSWSMSSHLESGISYELNYLDFSDRKQEYTSHIGRLRFLAMLNVKLSLSAFMQYNSAVEKVISNVRFRYNPREGCDFYLVYDEGFNMNRERMDPILPVTSNRTILLKYNYTFNVQ